MARDPSAFLSRGKLNADGYYSLGVLNFNEGYFEAAVADFERCLRMDPSHSNAYCFLGEMRRWVLPWRDHASTTALADSIESAQFHELQTSEAA
jgi:tetratricopeptide (TPR) repeat protein